MATTLPNIVLPKGVWTDLYAESTIDVATAIRVQNIGSTEIRLYSGLTAPVPPHGFKIAKPYDQAENLAEDTGAWALSPHADGVVNVEAA